MLFSREPGMTLLANCERVAVDPKPAVLAGSKMAVFAVWEKLPVRSRGGRNGSDDWHFVALVYAFISRKDPGSIALHGAA